jgi:signal transduction histidine kinase
VARLRIAFALVAAALLVPTALLARRALRAAEVERAARHETLAERLFDEMERSLSEFLRREEERPVGQYAFSYAPGGARSERVRSPLSRPGPDPEAPFVVGWFQEDPGGGVYSPLVPRDGEAAGAEPPGALARETAARVRRAAERALAAVPEEGLAAAEAPEAAERAAPARAGRVEAKRDLAEGRRARKDAAVRELEPAPRPLPGAALSASEAEGAAPEAPAAAGAPSAYDLLQSLNRSVLERQKRERKVLVAELDAPPALPPSEEGAVESRIAEAQNAPSEAAAEGARALAREPKPAAPATAASPAPPQRGAAAPRAAARQRPERISVDPFVGRRAGDELVLVRTVLGAERSFRQGLVLDAAGLAEWLRGRAIGSLALPGARLAFEPGGAFETGSPGDGAFAFRHRFAEPFDALSLELSLAPLADPPGARLLAWLAVFAALAGALGLVGLDRMVAARLAFARRRSELAASVSHELKTPLTAIRMHAEMLRDGLVPSEAKRREYYATLTDEAERLSRLIGNVLEFSRIERGARAMELRAGDLAAAASEVAAMLRPHAERAGFRLELALERGAPPVRFERDALAQVLFNLVENAIKYARAGERVVRIEFHAEGGRVLLRVRDRGPGVPPRDLARVFEPFFRGGDELTRASQGSGIGLALVRGLAERMGASASARNAEGGGFEVTLSFPPA